MLFVCGAFTGALPTSIQPIEKEWELDQTQAETSDSDVQDDLLVIMSNKYAIGTKADRRRFHSFQLLDLFFEKKT
jgi:hypothetical protein